MGKRNHVVPTLVVRDSFEKDAPGAKGHGTAGPNARKPTGRQDIRGSVCVPPKIPILVLMAMGLTEIIEKKGKKKRETIRMKSNLCRFP